jgi:hypothetical protein
MAKVRERELVQRRFGVADIAILILASGIGLAWIRKDLPGLFAAPRDLVNGRWVTRWSLPVALSKAVTVEIWLMPWAAAWLILQLRRPRPSFQRLSRQPGFVACLSSVAALLVSGPLTQAVISSSTSGLNGWLDRMVWGELVSSQMGVAVLAGWAVLAASQRCRIRSGWLDRVGQVIGLIWVAMIPANLAHFFWNSGWSN